MLDEAEWEQVLPHLRNGLEQIKYYRRVHNTSLAEAKAQVYGQGALERYHQITSFRETNVKALWHHRISQFGPLCSSCGRPLRTPRASFCAECGAPRHPEHFNEC
jgi:hypothetical protein